MSYHINTGLFSALFQAQTPEVYHTIIYFAIFLLCAAAAYFIGSINSAIFVCRALYGEDIRTGGDADVLGVWRAYGRRAGLLTLLGDVLKCTLAILLSAFFFGFRYAGAISVSEACYVAALFAVVGHIFPAYHKGHGGRGATVTLVMALVLSPIVALILGAVFALLLFTSKYTALATVGAAVLYPVLMSAYFQFVFSGTPMSAFISVSVITVAVLLVYTHRENLKRIGERTEERIEWRKGEDDAEK